MESHERKPQESNRPNQVALFDGTLAATLNNYDKYSFFGTNSRPFCPVDGSSQSAGRTLGGN